MLPMNAVTRTAQINWILLKKPCRCQTIKTYLEGTQAHGNRFRHHFADVYVVVDVEDVVAVMYRCSEQRLLANIESGFAMQKDAESSGSEKGGLMICLQEPLG
jgi:hypothetical protein